MAAFRYIELFAGVGGLGDALTWLDGHCVLAAELDDQARHGLLARHPNLPANRAIGDVRTLTRDPDGLLLSLEEVARRLPADIAVVCGGPPCQDFSKSGDQAGADGDRGSLTEDFLHVVAAARPTMVLMENVRNLAGPRHRTTYQAIVDRLDDLGYDVADDGGDPLIRSPHTLTPDAGGRPQFRERLFLIATRRDSDLAALTDGPVDLTALADAHGFDPHQWQVDDLLEADDQIADLDVYRMPAHQQTWIDAWDELVRALPDDRLPGELWADGFTDDLDDVLDRYLARARARAQARNQPAPTAVPDHARRKLERSQQLYRAHRHIIDPWLARTRGPVDGDGNRGTVADFPDSRRRLEFQARSAQPTAGDRNLWSCALQLRSSGIRVKPLTYLPALVAINNAPVIGPRRRVLTEREAWRLQALPVPAWSHQVTAGMLDDGPQADIVALDDRRDADRDVEPVTLAGVDLDAAQTAVDQIVDVWAAHGRAHPQAVRTAAAGAVGCGLGAGELLVAAASHAETEPRLNRPGIAHTRLLWDTYDLLASAGSGLAADPALAAVDWRVLVRMQAAVGRAAGQPTTAQARQYGAAQLPLDLPRVDTDGSWGTWAGQIADGVAAGWPTGWAVALCRSRLLATVGRGPGQRPLSDLAALEGALVRAGLAVIDPDGPDRPTGRPHEDGDLAHLQWAADHPDEAGEADALAYDQVAPGRMWIAEVDDASADAAAVRADGDLEAVIAECDGIDWDEWGTEWDIEQLCADLRVVDAHMLAVAGSPALTAMVHLAAYERFRQTADLIEFEYGHYSGEATVLLGRWGATSGEDLLDIGWGLALAATDAARTAGEWQDAPARDADVIDLTARVA